MFTSSQKYWEAVEQKKSRYLLHTLIYLLLCSSPCRWLIVNSELATGLSVSRYKQCMELSVNATTIYPFERLLIKLSLLVDIDVVLWLYWNWDWYCQSCLKSLFLILNLQEVFCYLLQYWRTVVLSRPEVCAQVATFLAVPRSASSCQPHWKQTRPMNRRLLSSTIWYESKNCSCPYKFVPLKTVRHKTTPKSFILFTYWCLLLHLPASKN